MGKNIVTTTPIHCIIILEGMAFHMSDDMPPLSPSSTKMKLNTFVIRLHMAEGMLLTIFFVFFLTLSQNDF